MSQLFLAYLITVNIYAVFIMYADKQRAKEKKWRISERQLWTTAFLFGSFGIMVGMNAFRHKTRHKSFVIGVPLLFTLQVIGMVLVVKEFVL